MNLDWYCTDMLKVRHLCRCGLLWTLWKGKKLLVSTFNFTHLTFGQNMVAIVSSKIAKLFNPSKCWMVTIQLLLNDTLFNQCLLLFIASYLLLNFCMYSALIWFSVCSMQCFFFDSILFAQCSNYSVYVLSWSWKYSRYFDPVKHQSSSSP